MCRSSKHRPARARTGRLGERIAALYLWLRGYRVLLRNHRMRGGELDLVVRKGKTVRIVEVRTVRSDFLASPAHAADARKRRQVRRLAARLSGRFGDVPLPCDVIGVRLRPWRLPEVVWLRDVED